MRERPALEGLPAEVIADLPVRVSLESRLHVYV